MKTAITATMIAAISVLGVGAASAATVPAASQTTFIAAHGSLGGGEQGGSSEDSQCRTSRPCGSSGQIGTDKAPGGRSGGGGSTGSR